MVSLKDNTTIYWLIIVCGYMKQMTGMSQGWKERIRDIFLQGLYNAYETILCYLKAYLGYLKMYIFVSRITFKTFSKEV